jgi:hypothetical protein
MRKVLFAMVLGVIASATVSAQLPTITNWRSYDQSGVNVFEAPKDENTRFDGLKVRFGAGFTQQFQALNHSNINDTAIYKLKPITPGFATAQANLNMDVQLEDGVRLNVVTYLSSRHHNEAWVKGGFIQFDKLGFLGADWLDGVMKYVTIKVGHMEVNYGDAHFRRSDGGQTAYNPFMENNIVDAFATEIGGEVLFRHSGFLAMVGLTNGAIKGSVDEVNAIRDSKGNLIGDSDTSKAPAMLFKIGYDNTFGENLRVRLTGSGYMVKSSQSNTLFGGDRTGSNYWMVMEPVGATYTANAFSGRVNPGFSDKVDAFMVNLFVKYTGLEFFGTFETATGHNAADRDSKGVSIDRSFTQIVGDVVYRMGATENFYVGARYNLVSGNLITNVGLDTPLKQTVDRIAIAAGWYLTKNILLKGEYVMQKYGQGASADSLVAGKGNDKDFPNRDIRHGGKFDGFVLEAAVGL